jgi:hypothetical protein
MKIKTYTMKSMRRETECPLKFIYDQGRNY